MHLVLCYAEEQLQIQLFSFGTFCLSRCTCRMDYNRVGNGQLAFCLGWEFWKEIPLLDILSTSSNLQVWEGRWRVIPHDVLPDWLKDNDYLLHGHRPPMPSFRACFKSIFRIHTETGNIWTHLLGISIMLRSL